MTTPNLHKTLSDIERDVTEYYAGHFDGLDASLRIACRALGIAAHLHGGAQLTEAYQLVYAQLNERQLATMENRR